MGNNLMDEKKLTELLKQFDSMTRKELLARMIDELDLDPDVIITDQIVTKFGRELNPSEIVDLGILARVQEKQLGME